MNSRTRAIFAKSFPKELPGSVQKQWVKCGTPNCKCTRGELHGPYYYRFYWERGRQRKRYVRLDQVEEVRTACDNYRVRRQLGSEYMDAFRELLDLLRHWNHDQTHKD